jgi:hypothetical protein
MVHRYVVGAKMRVECAATNYAIDLIVDCAVLSDRRDRPAPLFGKYYFGWGNRARRGTRKGGLLGGRDSAGVPRIDPHILREQVRSSLCLLLRYILRIGSIALWSRRRSLQIFETLAQRDHLLA